jgi:hypothetical protein
LDARRATECRALNVAIFSCRYKVGNRASSTKAATYMRVMGAVIAMALLIFGVSEIPVWMCAPRMVQEAQMARNPKDDSEGPPGGRALERLRQFENARRPPDAAPDSEQESDTAAPRGTTGKRDGPQGGNGHARKGR